MKLPMRPVEAAFLAVILAVAFGLRYWGSGFGLPHVYHPDEGFEIYRALRLGMGGFDFERVAKGGYYFILFFEYGVYFVLSFVTGSIGGVGDFAREFATDPSAFWRIARTTTAFLGAATAFLVWWQTRRMGSGRAGLLGAAFVAVSYRHVIDSHYATVDVPMALFAFWSTVMMVEDVSGRSRMSWWKFALVAAFAVMCKLPAIVIFVPYFLGVFLRGGFKGDRGLFSLQSWIPPVAAGVIYLIANPGFLVNIASMFALAGDTFGGSDSSGGEYAGVEQTKNLWWYYFWVTVVSQGPAMLALALVGAVVGLIRRSQGVLLHLALLIPFYVLIAATSTAHLFYERYIIPLVPGVCLLAALGLDDLIRRVFARREPVGSWVAVAVALVVIAEPAMSSIDWSARHSRTDTRTLTKEWIETNVPHKTRVLLEGFPEEDSQLAVPLRNTRKNVKEMIARLQSTDPGKATFWEYKLEALENPLYDLVTIRHFEPWVTVDEARANGVEYVILRREFFTRTDRDLSKLDPVTVTTRMAFREELDQKSDVAEMAAAFRPADGDRPGYDIEIWRLQPLAEETAEARLAELSGADQ